MKLYMKQKIFSLTTDFTIKDEFENDKYFVKGELLSLTHKLHITDTQQNEVIFIKQIILSLLPKFEIYVNNDLVTILNKKFTMFNQKFTFDNLDIVVTGDFLAHNYTINKDDIEIGTITKTWFSLSDFYEINIERDVDELLIIAVVLAIDLSLHTNNGAT